jgi:hypothetical protein
VLQLYLGAGLKRLNSTTVLAALSQAMASLLSS